MAVPGGSVIERLATNGALLPLLRIAHASRLQLLHVVVQLHLCLGRALGGQEGGQELN